MVVSRTNKLMVVLRLVMAGIMLWAFFDKLIGLGFSTPPDKSWLAGGSPTLGYLKFATQGPLSTIFQSIAGNFFIDWLFMLGLLGVGLSMLLGIGMKIGSYSGALIIGLIWLSAFPPKNNPFLDEHIVYLLIFLNFAHSNVGDQWGFGEKWKSLGLVKKYPFLI